MVETSVRAEDMVSVKPWKPILILEITATTWNIYVYTYICLFMYTIVLMYVHACVLMWMDEDLVVCMF